mgnify:CR=1 FL=1
MYGKIQEHLQQELAGIKEAGLYKNERIITTPQRANIKLNDGRDVLNFCANNYLGLSDNQRLIDAAKRAMDTHGYGMSSVRFICGCQDIHKQLEKAIADYFGTEDTILYAACFDANGGVFEPLFTERRVYLFDTARIDRRNSNDSTVVVEFDSYLPSSPDKITPTKVSFALQDGIWYLSNPTY